jgi:hypothetical protein
MGAINRPLQLFHTCNCVGSVDSVSWGCELFHSWFLDEKVLESLLGRVGKRSRGDSKLVGRGLAFASMRENCVGIASKLLHFISPGQTFF